MAWKGFRDVQATILIDLAKSEEELWLNLKKTARKNIKRANSYNLAFRECDDWETFYKMYEETWRKGGDKPNSIERIKRYRLFGAYYGNEMVGGGVVDIDEERLKFFAISVKESALDMQAYAFLYWNLILWAKKNGLKKADLGGYQLNAKAGSKLYYVNVFKEKWGGEITKYYVYSKNPFYILGRKLIRNSSVAKWIWDRAKGRPLKEKKEYTRV